LNMLLTVAKSSNYFMQAHRRDTALALTETDPPVLIGIDPLTMAGDGGMRR